MLSRRMHTFLLRQLLFSLTWNQRSWPKEMNKFIVFLMLSMLIAINCQMVNSCPPCADVNGEKRYCVKSILSLKVCEAASQKGGRCSTKQDGNGVYQGLPPCKEGLTCSNPMSGKCE